jgi:hypothetical protein
MILIRLQTKTLSLVGFLNNGRVADEGLSKSDGLERLAWFVLPICL